MALEYEYAIRETNISIGDEVLTGWSTYDYTYMKLQQYRSDEAAYVEGSGFPLLYTYVMLRRPMPEKGEELDV